MYAARRNRIRLRVTLVLMIASMIAGAIISLQIAHLELSRINEYSTSNSSATSENRDWIETLSGLGEEVIQLFMSMTSESR